MVGNASMLTEYYYIFKNLLFKSCLKRLKDQIQVTPETVVVHA